MGYFRTIPKEIEECAMADGAHRMESPRPDHPSFSIPGLLSAGIFCFTLCWNDSSTPLIFKSSGDR